MNQSILTAESYANQPDDDTRSELVRGRIVQMKWPDARYGQICGTTLFILGEFGESARCGHFVGRSGVITERNLDTVRGADFSYYSFSKFPRGPLPWRYLSVAPDLVFQVRCPDDRWGTILLNVSEYLEVGVKVVCVLDDDPPRVYLYTADQPVRILEADHELELPDVLPGFRVKVRRFFE
jgi:Uma2 family endonuclease